MIDSKTLREINKRKVFQDQRDVPEQKLEVKRTKGGATIPPRDIIVLLNELGATIDNNALSSYFAKKGINISPNSIRSIKSNLNR